MVCNMTIRYDSRMNRTVCAHGDNEKQTNDAELNATDCELNPIAEENFNAYNDDGNAFAQAHTRTHIYYILIYPEN